MSKIKFTFVDGSKGFYHHGVKGMKWGVRHDRPKTNRLSNRQGLSDKSKKRLKTAAKVGAIAVSVGLAAYGGYKLYSGDPTAKRLMNLGKSYAGEYNSKHKLSASRKVEIRLLNDLPWWHKDKPDYNRYVTGFKYSRRLTDLDQKPNVKIKSRHR